MKEVEVLALLFERGPLTVKAMCSRAGWGAGSAWVVLERLRLSGRISRDAHEKKPGDSSKYAYALTRSGERFYRWKKRKRR